MVQYLCPTACSLLYRTSRYRTVQYCTIREELLAVLGSARSDIGSDTMPLPHVFFFTLGLSYISIMAIVARASSASRLPPVLPLMMDARTSTIWIRWIRFVMCFAVAVPFLLLVGN